MLKMTLIIVVALSLVACAAELKGPSAEIKMPRLTIDDGRGFCPPGQAKKGNC